MKTFDNLERTRLPTLRCRCGAEILLLPDLKAMNKAIEAHVRSHSKKARSPQEVALEVERVRNSLIRQLLRKAGGASSKVLSF